MERVVFQFEDYKEFIHHLLETAPRGGRGLRRRLAEKCGCQVAYISHVLSGDKNFSLEQAEAAARFFNLREDETDFFLGLVERARAGTPELRTYFDRQLDIKRRSYREIKKRIRIEEGISENDQATYYSSWHFQAIRSLLTIPGFTTPEKLAQHLGIDIKRVNEVLLFLMTSGLVQESSKGYQATGKLIHLPGTSPLISKLHTNWRMKTIASLDQIRVDDYHYSGLVTLSEADFATVREILTRALSDAIEVVKPSKEEKLGLLAMDFFELKA